MPYKPREKKFRIAKSTLEPDKRMKTSASNAEIARNTLNKYYAVGKAVVKKEQEIDNDEKEQEPETEQEDETEQEESEDEVIVVKGKKKVKKYVEKPEPEQDLSELFEFMKEMKANKNKPAEPVVQQYQPVEKKLTAAQIYLQSLLQNSIK